MGIIHKNLKLFLFFAMLLSCTAGYAQQKTITGKVTDGSTGEALPGVTIVVEGTTYGTITNINGEYTINVEAGQVLAFSYIGYVTQQIVVGEEPVINVVLPVDTEQLEEVVVIGYGQVKKSDATGSVSVVDAKDFNKGAITSPQELLMGKSAGVSIITNSGAPGSGATIRIRGGSSMRASNDPLIIIDGFPIDNGNVSGSSNALSTINPNDIESFTVLKDASATAIYGSRASNGVIIITTKKGKAGQKLEVNYNSNFSVSKASGFIDVFSGDEFRGLAATIAANNSIGLTPSDLSRLGNANTDWQDEIYRTALSFEHNLSLTGAVGGTPFRISYGNTNQNGILRTTNFTRNTLDIGVDPSFLENRLQVNIKLKGSYTKNDFGNTGAIGAAVAYDPTQPVMNGNTRFDGYHTWVNISDVLPDGSLNPNGYPNPLGVSNPVALLEQTDNRSTVKRVIGNIILNYNFKYIPGLRANLNTGYDILKSAGHNNAPDSAPWTFRQGIGQKNDYDQKNSNELFDFYLNYVKDIDAISSKIDVTAGYSWQHFKREGSTFNRNGDGSVVTENSSYINENFLVSFFGRVNYTLKDKYLLTVTLRNDGSSRFSKDNRWGLFPAAAFAWKINKENFLANFEPLSDLKLRLGYGITGQQDISTNYYPYLPVYRKSEGGALYQFGNKFYNTLRPSPYDANIKWEETTTYNIGLDFGFFNNKINGSLDIYQRKTKDLINNIPIAAGSNFSNFLVTNVGNLENKGAELTINARPVSKRDISWDLGFNISYNENKVTKLTKTDDPNYPGVDAGSISGGVGNFIQNISVGYPINSFFVYQQVYNTNGMPIEGVYVDLSGNGGNVTSSNLNKYRYKDPAADVLMGISSRVMYKQFDLSFSGRVSLGNYVYNNVASDRALYSSMYNQSGFFNNLPKWVNNTGFSNTQYWSDYYVENASFFRMDNITLGYDLTKALNNTVSSRISFTVQNAFIITKYTGLDPEIGATGDANRPTLGIDNNIYPRPRVFLFGVNFTF
ncbi:Outer membrane TonB-dependent transporter, utilization system for glycans and polysaccharides (PUL), SusC family [hydrothermal vent metagenome]|uniref:Outer membrane TonB-dependent transporter, utilization system for glycans and polysaccharides (PUL), SusC family n=1 Tax=hydrothermal vent metagenome TaxID=652676 RepID=A0A3B0TMR3_9ZZZZ